MPTMLIAETGAAGEVEWVWISDGRSRGPRPLSPRRSGLVDDDRAVVVGAKREAVRQWLRDRAEGTGPRAR